jgi:RNA polymerase sigma-70 factor (ECF subfamily)
MGTASPARHPARDTARAPIADVAETDVDLRLVERVQGRDEAALGELYDRWSDRVYAVALHLVGERRRAEEVVEKAFAQVWAEAGRYHAGWGSVEAWVILIARRHARGGFAR